MGVFLMNYSYFDLDFGTRIAKALVPELLVLPPKLFMAYSIMYFIIPRMGLITRWKLIAALGAIIAISLIIYHFLLQDLVFPIVYKESPPESTISQGISRFIWRLLDMLAVVGTACSFRLLRKQAEDAKKEKQLIQEKLQSELNFLRAQTNPHFLFNTLNTIYALSRKQSPETPDTVMQLSKLLRYMLDECKEPFVPLEKEWKVIENYVAIEKLRYGDRVKAVLKNETTGHSFMIAPLLFLPLVENAFKHGAGNNRFETEISIHIKQEGDGLYFMVQNNVDVVAEANSSVSGIGLQNVKRHLELLYPDHMMNIENHDGRFTASIHLKTNKNGTAMSDHRR